MGRGLAPIARILRGKAPCGAGIACSRLARWDVAPHELGDGGESDPTLGADAPSEQGKWSSLRSTT